MRISIKQLRKIVVAEARTMLEGRRRCRCNALGCFHAGYDCHNTAGSSTNADGEPLCDACADTQPSNAAEETQSHDWQCPDCGKWFFDLKTLQRHIDKHFPPGAKKSVRLKSDDVD